MLPRSRGEHSDDARTNVRQIWLIPPSTTVNREVFTSLSPDFITWEQIARWAVEICASTSEISVVDKGVTPASMSYDVSAIQREFGLKFDAAGHLREHLAYLAGPRV